MMDRGGQFSTMSGVIFLHGYYFMMALMSYTLEEALVRSLIHDARGPAPCIAVVQPCLRSATSWLL